MMLPPPITHPADVDDALRERGHAVVEAAGVCAWLQTPPAALDAWWPFWDRLPPDPHLRDGGHYRRRRHGCFVLDGAQVGAAAHRAHWQPIEYNALHGGIERWFEPIEPELAQHPLWLRLLRVLALRASALRGAQRWFVETHPFRIDTAGGIGRPTPEGAHRDGVDLVAVLLVRRHRVKGGETRVFDAKGPHGLRFTMSQPWTLLLLDDTRVIHETTPIQPLLPTDAGPDAAVATGYRDTLVVTLRARAFQGP
jgi:hypothetical protein